MPEIAVAGLVKTFGDQRALDHVDFKVNDGELFTLLGPSGCGKSTTLMSIAGFQHPEEGRIAVGEETIFDAQKRIALPAERRNLGIVFQSYAVWPHMTVHENLAFPLKVRRLKRGEIRSRIAETLELVEMTPYEKRYPHQLSGGQQQRVALARALVYSPSILLLDEPFSNLDVDLRERLSLEVRAILKAAGTTATLVTHDQNDAFAIADEIGLMKDGAIEQWDSAYNLYHRPRTRFVADFIGQGVFVRGVASGNGKLRTELGELESDGDGSVAAGAPMDLLLRPDDITHDDASPWRAEVTAKAFRGAEFLYTLKLASGTRVLSLVPSHHNHAIGEQIGIRLAIDHVVAFPAGA